MTTDNPIDLDAIEVEYRKITNLDIWPIGLLGTLDNFFIGLFARLRSLQPSASQGREWMVFPEMEDHPPFDMQVWNDLIRTQSATMDEIRSATLVREVVQEGDQSDPAAKPEITVTVHPGNGIEVNNFSGLEIGHTYRFNSSQETAAVQDPILKMGKLGTPDASGSAVRLGAAAQLSGNPAELREAILCEVHDWMMSDIPYTAEDLTAAILALLPEAPAPGPEKVSIARQTLMRWYHRISRCDTGGFPTNVRLEMEILLDLPKSGDLVEEAPAPLAYDGAAMDIPWIIRSLEKLAEPLSPNETGILRMTGLISFIENLKFKFESKWVGGEAK